MLSLECQRKMKTKKGGNGILCKFYGKTCAENFIFHLAEEKNLRWKKVLNKLKWFYFIP